MTVTQPHFPVSDTAFRTPMFARAFPSLPHSGTLRLPKSKNSSARMTPSPVKSKIFVNSSHLGAVPPDPLAPRTGRGSGRVAARRAGEALWNFWSACDFLDSYLAGGVRSLEGTRNQRGRVKPVKI